MKDPEIAWLKTLFSSEITLRRVFSQHPLLTKRLLSNAGFLQSLFKADTGAFAALLAAPMDGGKTIDSLLGLVSGDGVSETPRQRTVIGKLENWLADDCQASRAFCTHPELTQVLVSNPAFVERVKLLKPEFFRELLSKGRERFCDDATLLAAISESERVFATFTTEGGWRNERIQTEKELMQAADMGDAENVKILLGIGANPIFQDGEGWSPLMRAAGYGHAHVVKLLIKRGADINMRNKNGETAVFWAAGNGYTDVVKLLLGRTADPNIQNSNGWTALMRATINRYTTIVKLLLDVGADPNVQDRYGRTALMLAAGNGSKEIMNQLIRKGANPDVLDRDGKTALNWAFTNRQTEAYDLLCIRMKEKSPNAAKTQWTSRIRDVNDRNRE